MSPELAKFIGVVVGLVLVVLLGFLVPGVTRWISRTKVREWKASKLRTTEEKKVDYEVIVGEPEDGEWDWVAALLGAVERVLFLGALWIDAGILVAAWLGLKVASKWQSWALSNPQGELGNPQRILAVEIGYLRFLIGTGINIVFALVGVGVGRLVASALAG